MSKQVIWGPATEPTLFALRGIRFMAEPGGNEPPEPKPWTPPASQEEFDRVITDRLNREKAKYTDYDDLKAAKARLDEIEAGQKTDLQKERDRAEAAEKRATELEQNGSKTEVELMKMRVATDKGITGKELKLLTGTTEQELKDAADTIVELRRGSRRDPSQGQLGDQPRESRGIAEARRRGFVKDTSGGTSK
jgi:hypothetical protein